ncbi:MCE family protein [Pseudonocardia spinosispora]|uniref:MCE family protein n=1 Tax=Pseudonocardia spinosispora TaxID=103441 RepID=UPI000685CF7A|nr:MCE family protein [Pseudonocardia spinosispora]
MNPIERPVRAAVIGLVVIAAVLTLSMNLNRLPVIGGGPEYRAEFTDAAGLQVGEEVRVAGIKAGQVTAMALTGDHVTVDFRVTDQRLGRDTRASIEIKTLLGQHFLAVQPRGLGELPPGGTIPLSRTSTPVQIAPTVQELTSRVSDIDTTQLAAAFDTLSETLHATAPQVRGTLDGLAALSRTVNGRDEQIQRLFAHARGVTGVLASRDREITELIGASNQVLDVLHRRRDDIHRLLVGTRDVFGELSGVVADNRQQLRPALDRLHQVIEVLTRNDQNLDRILTQLPVHLRLLTTMAGSGHWFDTDLIVPQGFAVCDSGASGRLAALFDPALSRANQAVNGSSAPCLPLGPAAHPTGGGR